LPNGSTASFFCLRNALANLNEVEWSGDIYQSGMTKAERAISQQCRRTRPW